ncbi:MULTISPECIES: glycoside hydrolase family protein [unclassified Sphingobium]|uniref:glycoside hydrolase family protein n=1 Tax=unclassified Sphingobium TaxID=2611147 RepID=UPI002223F78F|nr:MULTISPECIES: glycoside hydrolase family protein [unclassified Sphingobium]MCW2411996.1 lysozyme [Sphingobium sp. B8D3D]MCW2415706.1 lysozyme [Sphingobium sp. B8D3A]
MADAKMLATGVASAMLAIAVPFGISWEGMKLNPYKDLVGVWTVCGGATHVPMRPYTEAECREITLAQYRDFGEGVRASAAGIDREPWQWASHTTFASNIGISAYARSSVRRLFVQGRYVEACRAMRLYKYAGGKVVAGLVYRREGKDRRIGEYELCMVGAVPAELGGA